MKKMSEHGNGIMLIPAATETNAFIDHVWGKNDGILFMNLRPHFCDTNGIEAKGNCGSSICLVAYGQNNYNILKASGLGHLVTEDQQ